MTVASSTNRSGPYAGAGTVGPFTIGFRFLDNTHLLVVRKDPSNVETTLTLGVDYTAAGAGTVGGGTLLLTAVLAAGYSLTIQRNVPLTQLADYTQSDAFPAESHEDALDKLTMIAQQIDTKANTSLRVPETASTLPMLPAAAARANLLVGFDSAGNPITVAPTSGSATALALDLANKTSAPKGAGQIGFSQSQAYAVGTVGRHELSFPTAKDDPWNAAGDNVATDTTAYQAFLNSGVIDIVPVSAAGFKAIGLTVPATIKSIKGQRFYQSAVDTDILTATGRTGLRISGSDFYGVAGTVVAANNSGLKLDTCSSVQGSDLYFEGLRIYALWFKGVTDSSFANLQGKGNSDGFRFTSCKNVVVSAINLYAPQTPAATFIIAVGIDSTDGGNTVCESLTFNGINVRGYVNAQAIMVHAGKKLSFNGGVLDDVSIGVGVTQFNTADLIQDIAVSGFDVNCTSTPGAVGTGSYGVTVYGYDGTFMAERVSVTGNNIRGANTVDQSVDRGGIAVQFVKGITLCNNISGGYANGYAFYRRVQDIDLRGGSVSDVAVFGGENNGIRFGESASGWMSANGRVADVKLRNLGVGIRLGITAAAACAITRVGATATATKVAHGYMVGDWQRIAGVTFAAPADGYFNGSFQVATVPTADTFTYTMAGVPTNAAALGAPTTQGSYDGLYVSDINYESVTTQVTNPTYAVLDGVRGYVPGDKAPYVGRTRQMSIANASAVVITSFRGGILGQVLRLTFGDAFTTLSHGSSIKTVGGADFVGANLQSIELACIDAVTPVWVPVGQTTTVS